MGIGNREKWEAGASERAGGRREIFIRGGSNGNKCRNSG